jgi:hypothetical protein
MKKIVISGLVFVFVFASVSALNAQEIYIGALAGYSSETPTLPDIQDIELDSKATLFYGGRLGLKISMIAIEAMYIRASHELTQIGTGVIDWDGRDLEYQYIGANVKLFPLSLAVFHPYLMAGYGYYMAEIQGLPDNKDQTGSYSVGAGLELKFSKIALVAEGKYRRGDVVIDGNDLELGNFSLNVGLNIYF